MRYAIAAVVIAGVLAGAGCTDGDSGADTTTAAPTETAAPATESTPTAPTGTEPPDAATTVTEPSDTGTTEVVPDPAGEAAAAAFDAFVGAAGSGHALAMWDLLTEASRERLGPTFDSFQIGVGRELQEGLGSFAGTPYEILVASGLDGGLAVVAVAGQREAEGLSELAAYAAVLRDERGGWKVELGSPVGLDPVLPGSGTLPAGESPELAVGVEGSEPIGEALLWLDGKPLDGALELSGDGTTGTLTGRPAEPLAAGAHVAVAFARAGAEAAAQAWVIPAR